MSAAPYSITPALLREAQTYLYDGVSSSAQEHEFSCYAVSRAAGEWQIAAHVTPSAAGYLRILRSIDALPPGCVALPFEAHHYEDSIGSAFRQSCRFMLLELIALAIEDGTI